MDECNLNKWWETGHLVTKKKRIKRGSHFCFASWHFSLLAWERGLFSHFSVFPPPYSFLSYYIPPYHDFFCSFYTPSSPTLLSLAHLTLSFINFAIPILCYILLFISSWSSDEDRLLRGTQFFKGLEGAIWNWLFCKKVHGRDFPLG